MERHASDFSRPSFQVALPHSLPLPRRETLQQSSSLSTVSPATVDLTLKVHKRRESYVPLGEFKQTLSLHLI